MSWFGGLGTGRRACPQTFELELGEATNRTRALAGVSYEAILERVFGIHSHFDIETERELRAFKELRNEVLRNRRPLSDLRAEAARQESRSLELKGIVWTEYNAAESRLGGQALP